MKSKIVNLAVILALAYAAPAWSDDLKVVVGPDEASEKAARDPKSSAASYTAQHKTIMKECGVDASNEMQLLSLLESWDEVTRSIMASAPSPRKENADLIEKLRIIDKEIEAARQSKNPDLVQDLTKNRVQLEEMISGIDPETKRQLEEVDKKYGGAVRELVAPEKLDRLDEILESAQETQLNRPRRGPVRSPRALKAITDRLGDLTPEQRRNIDGVFQQFREWQRDNRGHSAEKAAQERKLYDDVFAILTDGQKTRVEQQLGGQPRGAANADPKAPATAGAAASPAEGSDSKASDKPATPAAAPAKDAPAKP